MRGRTVSVQMTRGERFQTEGHANCVIYIMLHALAPGIWLACALAANCAAFNFGGFSRLAMVDNGEPQSCA